jgi:hypothetical protein
VDRQDLPSVFRSFDFASPDTSTAERFQTTVPQQALYLMNHPFVIDCAKALAGRLPDSPAEQRLRTLYQLVFQRNPSTEETVSLLQYLGMPPHGAATTHETPLSRWESLAQGLLLANESLFVD